MPTTPHGRRLIARTALVASTITVGMTGFIIGAFDPLGWQQQRAITAARDATAVLLCIQQDAYQTRLEGIQEEIRDGDVALRNLQEVLENGLADMESASRDLGTSCPMTTDQESPR